MNKAIFHSNSGRETANNCGAPAYSLTDKEFLAKYAVTSMIDNTFYVSAEDSFLSMRERMKNVDPVFLAKLAIYARQEGKMKDTSLVILVYLMEKDPELFAKIFERVVDSSRTFLSFLKIVRSGQISRRHIRRSVRNVVKNYMRKRNTGFYLNATGDLSMGDALRLVHPNPVDREQEALWKYIVKGELSAAVPKEVLVFERFKNGETDEVPNISFMKLTNCELSVEQWKKIFSNMPFNTLRKNINMALRKGVLDDPEMVNLFVEKILAGDVKKFKIMPYELFITIKSLDSGVPFVISNALQDVLERTIENVPEISGKYYIGLDVSGSMGGKINQRSQVSFVDVAALFAASLVKRNPNIEVHMFDTSISRAKINMRDSLFTIASSLAANGGGTDCSLIFQTCKGKKLDGIIMISDNESNSQFQHTSGRWGRGPACMDIWNEIKWSNKEARLINLDIAGYNTSQTYKRDDVLMVGGFNDNVYSVMSDFLTRKTSWLDAIEKVSL